MESKKATGIYIPKSLIKDIAFDSIPNFVSIRLQNTSNPVSILGDFTDHEDKILFKPLVAFTRGLSYKIIVENRLIAAFRIPDSDPAQAPSFVAIFPSADTLPENLLKIYLHFSQLMREGKSGGFVTLIKNKSDTVQGTFLDLQPELWNDDRTILTLWLDPGRIKRDLQPNITLGAPLQNRGKYHIEVSKNWQDEQGLPPKKGYTKIFFATNRDSLSPNPENWHLKIPEKGTSQPLILELNEILDYSLLAETLTLLDQQGEITGGEWLISNEERKCHFVPTTNWHSGRYTLRIQTRLEDLAGNNLNRPFEHNISGNEKPAGSSLFRGVTITIKP